jgi:hypothetical protein
MELPFSARKNKVPFYSKLKITQGSRHNLQYCMSICMLPFG